MAYTPVAYTKGGVTVLSEDPADEVRLAWEGWARVGAVAPLGRDRLTATLADLDALETRLRELLLEGGGGSSNTGTGYTAQVDPFDDFVLLLTTGVNAQVDADPAVLLLTTVPGGAAQVDGTDPAVMLVTI